MSAFAYIALMSRQTTPRSDRLTAFVEAQRRSGMEVVHENPTLLVLAPPRTPRLCLAAGSGVVIGYAFERATSSRLTALPEGWAEPAERLTTAIWGNYVAFRSRQMTPEVVRDPSGTLPCYHVEVDEVHVITSEPRLVINAGLLTPEIDWTILAQALVFHDIKPARTALRGVSEILPGTAGKVYPTGLEVRCVWSPWHFTEPSERTMTFAEAVNTVGTAVAASGAAWSGCFERPLFEISGGLDSAIVAAVAAIHPGHAAITYGAVDGDPNEVPYAQAVAEHFRLNLTVIASGTDGVDVTASSAADLPRPYARSFSQGFDRAAQQRALAIGADAFFSGGGGDSVFCYLQSLSPIFDRLAKEGLSAGVLSSIRDVAILGNTDVWEVAYRMIRRMSKHRKPPWHIDHRLLNPAAVHTLPFPGDNPWTQVPDRMPPGKAAHVYAIIMIQNFLEGFPQTNVAPIISPLLSQPVIEACLAVPTWLWCAGGVNRAVARSAFAASLPPSVAARRSKGAFDSLAARLIRTNRSVIRSMLLGGLLSEHGLLDEPGVERALADEKTPHRVRLAQLVDAEAWARSWQVTTRW